LPLAGTPDAIVHLHRGQAPWMNLRGCDSVARTLASADLRKADPKARSLSRRRASTRRGSRSPILSSAMAASAFFGEAHLQGAPSLRRPCPASATSFTQGCTPSHANFAGADPPRVTRCWSSLRATALFTGRGSSTANLARRTSPTPTRRTPTATAPPLHGLHDRGARWAGAHRPCAAAILLIAPEAGWMLPARPQE
jgi:hypothetical protein